MIRIDPSTGDETRVASVPVLDMCGGLVLGPSGLTFFKHAVYFLDGPRLYRVKP